jgi:hypothetical protein
VYVFPSQPFVERFYRYYNPQGELIAECSRESIISGNDQWKTNIRVMEILPPAVFVFIPAFKSLANRRKGKFFFARCCALFFSLSVSLLFYFPY